MIERQGCSDGNCKLRIGLIGQHTNGGCQCLRDVPTALRLQIEKKLAAQRKLIRQLTRDRELLVELHAWFMTKAPEHYQGCGLYLDVTKSLDRNIR